MKGNEKGENGNEKGKENVNEKKRRNGSGNENEIGIVTGQKRETGTERETGTAIGKGARIGIRIGVDQGKAWWKLLFADSFSRTARQHPPHCLYLCGERPSSATEHAWLALSHM